MTGPKPLVSVIIPLHNGKRFIAEAVNSVLQQTLSDFELIVFDDGSSDGGADCIPSDHRVRVVRTAQGGNASARNRGMDQSRGELIAFLDQDDYWHPEKLTLQSRHLLSDATCDAAISLVRYVIDASTERPQWLHQTIYDDDKPGYLVGALLARRGVFTEYGAFRERFDYGSDSDWFFRARDNGLKNHTVPAVLLYKRVHEQNQTHHMSESRQEFFRLVKDSVDRKKAAKR